MNIKKLAVAATTAALYLSTLPTRAFAVDLCPGAAGGSGGLCQTPDLDDLINTIINFVFIIGIIAAVIWLIWGGIKWITSGGDKTKVESARSAIIGAIIGLVIVFSAYFIVTIVFRLLTGTNLQEFEIGSLFGGF